MRPHDPQFKNRCFICLGLAVVTLALYLPALHHGFVEYDDQQYVTDNPRVQAGLTWNGLVWAFGFHAGNWHPLAWLSHMLDVQLFGAQAWGHHLTSVLLHTATTLLLFLVLNRMIRLRASASARQASVRADAPARPADAMWRSAAVAALFAWHPLHVESVAWVAERKDVLCAFFWMLTLWCYAKRDEGGVLREKNPAGGSRITHHASFFYWLAFLFFALALMAKPMAVTLPFVLLLLDFWPLKRISDFGFRISDLKKLLLEKVPFFILSAVACWLTLQAQQIAIVSTAGLTMPQRFAHTLAAYNHYFWAMFFPSDLAVYYPYVISLQLGTVVFAGAVMLAVTLLAVINLRRRPYLIVGWLWFLGTLVPVIGLVQVGDQAWADRYTYLPLIGLFVPLVWLAAEVIKNKIVLRTLVVTGSLAMLAATSVQLSYWKNTRTLFEHTAKVTQQNALAVTILGSLLAKEGKLDEAMKYYQTALRYTPNFPEAHFFLGNALDEQGRQDEAVAEYEKSLWFRPTQEQTHIFMGIALAKQKKYDQAILHYNAALKLNPDSAATHNNLARIFQTLGQFDTAIEHYHAALAIDAKLSIAHNNLGILLLQKGDLAEGTRQLREAVRLRPKNAESKFNLALALNQQEQWSEAAGLFKKTLGSYSADPKAHYESATALFHLKKTREAMGEYAAALLIRPDFPDALDGLAWILSTDANADFRNGAEALKMAEQACALTGRNDPVKLRTLAAAYAETGRFAEAAQTIQTAKELAAKTNRQPLVNECAAMREHFQKSEPWRSF